MMGQSSRELNKAHWQGVPNDTPASAPSPLAGSPAPGSSGSAWRMTKLKRTYEAAEEEGRDVLEVALERYGSVEAFREAEEEKRILDERRGRGYSSNNSSQGRRNETPSGSGGEGRKYIYTSMEPGSAEHSRPPSRGSFRRPGEGLQRSDSTSSLKEAGGSRPTTPVPSVFTPPPARTPRAAAPSALSQSVVIAPDPTTSLTADNVKPPLSQSELNKLQAKVLKARLMGNDDADELEKEYERERERAVTAGSMGIGGAAPEAEVRMLPTLDGRGRLYDVGTGTEKPDESAPGKRKKKEKAFETHDPKTGERIRINPDDDSLSISELVRQERFAAGAQDQKDMDFEIASRIAGDARFDTDLDYMDEHAEKLARKKMKSEVMKKAFAIQDYAKTKKALDNCTLCYGDEDQPPRAAVVALGTRAYLGLLENEELVKGHCRIVPIQHHFSMLDADDETWDEIKNFMKTLMQMFAEEDKGVFFFESCISLKNQRHTWIEAIPVSFDLFDELPAYFAEAIDTSEQEWSQHKKRIVFSSNRPFRRSLVPNLPYFAVQWDYKGEKGYGHVIEGVDDAPERDADGDELRGEMGEKGAGEFPRWFAQEIIGNVLELEPRRWRKPKRLDYRQNKDRVAQFMAKYAKYDWTKMLKQA
ncbi:cell cycle control protein, Cwf19 [Pseudohyphozyma bogoriensis]|nr:cell cycle control protein, Cwf19 [Pseudohyphozyma bogoriensis]